MLRRNLAAWDIVFPGMYHVDNVKSQIGLGVHFIGGAYFVLMAPLQYVPWFRKKYLNFHRWNGRVAVTLLGITVVGGSIYTWEVGISQIVPEYQTSANCAMYVFGVLVFTCCVMLYYHAAISKQIDKHQLWAYRLAGMVFGSQMYFRLFLVEAMVLGENFDDIAMTSTMFVFWTFAIPFALLGDVVYWKLHGQKHGDGEQRQLNRYENGEAKQLIERDDTDTYEEEKSTSWRDVGKTIVYGVLLVSFIVTLLIWILYSWLPYCMVDFDHPVLPSWVRGWESLEEKVHEEQEQ